MTMENSSSSPDDESSLERFEKDMDFLLCDTQSESNGREHLDINVHLSGSAPPTVEESEATIESLLGNFDLADAIGLPSENDYLSPPPSYFPQYHNGEQHNPTLPQAVPFNEDWRAVSEGRRSSLFSMQSVTSVREMDRETRMGKQQNLWEQGIDGLTSSAAVVGLGPRSKSFSDALQDELKQPTALPPHLSLAKRYNATYGSVYDHMGASDEQPRPQVLRRSSSHCFPPPGAMVNVPSGGVSSCMASHDDVAIALSNLKLTKTRSFGGENRGDGLLHQEFSDQPEHKISIPGNQNSLLQISIPGNQNSLLQISIPGNQNSLLQTTDNSREIGSLSNPITPIVGYQDFSHKNGLLSARNISNLSANGQGQLLKYSFPADKYTMAPSVGRARYKDSGSLYNGSQLPNIDFCGSNNLTINRRLIDMANNQLDAAAIVGGGTVGEYPGRRGKTGHAFQGSLVDPVYSQYLQRSDFTGWSSHMNHPSSVRNYTHDSVDMPTSQRTLVRALLAQQELQYEYGIQHLGRSTRLDHGYRGGTSYGLGLPYPTSRHSSSILSSSSSGSALRHSEQLPRFPSLVKNSTVGSSGLWTPENHIDEAGFGSSFLEEFKHNKTQKFELAEIIGHVAEFSSDQYGSRFIQQKLETASVEEKSVIFPEILPHARDLMTDVFGNYVIQKFFEYGTENQRKQLADQLAGHVLPLSLHMYGCRVIQKALEVVYVDQQTEMVSELDGSVIRCVCDQNGNHVIQKCIECVPQEKIMFIVSTFYGQVVTLSSHPYGCRIIQRVLEYCDDVKTQNIVMDEILKSVSTLALDQYGNYVIQHVLQHGKPDERAAIISTLSGQVVKMSQQKFTSNVVEKCLTYGSSEERQLLINEMLGSTEENEPLQEMMKDQFGNYVVQKVLEICDDHDRELILSRIKIQLNALKRYTYGKHIVTRVEKLITTGERCTGVSSHSS